MKKKKFQAKEKKIFIIAEMACSHDGRIAKAKKIAEKAYQAGADAIQLQIWDLNKMMSPKNPNYNRVKNAEISKKGWIEIVRYVKKELKGILIYVCLYEDASIDFILSLKPDGIKINSSDLTNPFVLKKISKSNIPINLSVGSSSIKEIKYSIKFLKKNNLNLMYGFQAFPTPINAINLANIKFLKERFGLNVGYQDHCEGNDISGIYFCATSIGLGASIIEKHITIKRANTKFDKESALEPKEFKKFVKIIKNIETTIKPAKQPLKFTKHDLQYRKFQKKTFVYSKNLKKNHILTYDDMFFIRTNREVLSIFNITSFINKKLKKGVKKFDIIYPKDFV
jgi:sialic acid synthase SpsE